MYKKSAKKFSKKPRKAVKRNVRVSAVVKQYVKKAIHQNIENKKDWATGQGTINNALVGTALPVTLPLLPLISQGITQGTRLGDEIHIRSSKFTLNIWALPYNINTNYNTMPQHVRVMILKQKQLQAGSPSPNLADIASIFQLGLSSQGFINTLADMSRDVNTDIYTVKYNKVFKVGIAGPTTYTATTVLPNNDYHLQHTLSINVGKFMKKKLMYDDLRFGNNPSNDNLFMFVQTVAFNNSTAVLQPLAYQWEQHTSFEDA